MRPNFIVFARSSLAGLINAVLNLFMFLPYFFSVSALLKTLFSPWKNLQAEKGSVGFSFSEWASRFSFNLISRGMGFIMRFSLILFYFTAQSLLTIFIPIVISIYFLFLPVLYFFSRFEQTENQKKEKARERFFSGHILDSKNEKKVLDWFEFYYEHTLQKKKWWDRQNLFSLPPLARDWASGFTPILDQYAEDLTRTSYQSAIQNIVNRVKEINEIERILSQTTQANVLVVGEEGVGKHTIIDALAKKMFEGKTKGNLMYKRILKLNMEKVLTKFTDQNQRESFFEDLLEEASKAKNVILFVDDFDKYIYTSQDRVNLTSSFEKFLRSNRIQVCAITTPFLYQKFIVPSEKLSKLFSKVDVYEVNSEEAEQILLQTVFLLESRHKLAIPYETIKESIEKSEAFITTIPFPEKAIELLDSACVLAIQENAKIVTQSFIDRVLTEKTHIPATLTDEVKQKLINLQNLLSSHIVQQKEAVDKISSTLRRSFLLVEKRKKPLATFLFLGPTGVGKTETAKTITKVFFGDEKLLLRFDMSLYQSVNDIPRLIGSMESGDPGLLASQIRQHPYGVLLLDELEKANKDLLNIFLTILDEGFFTDGFGKRVDCKNLVIIATSNAGADFIYIQSTVAIPKSPENRVKDSPLQQTLIDHLIEKKIFAPEFLNRFDAVITYQALSEESVVELAKRMMSKVSEDVKKMYKVRIDISDVLLREIARNGYDPKFGARNMERLLRDSIEDKISKIILEGKVKEGETITL